MPKTLMLSLVIASAAAAILAKVADPRGFDEIAERASIAEQASAPGSKCPLSRESIDKADIRLLPICLVHGLPAYYAAQRYPETAAKVFAVYGQDETFQKILDQYGHQVIPVIAFYVENGSLELQYRQAFGEALQQIWAGQKPKWEPGKITREQIGLIAIYRIDARGHEMLAEFEIIEGVAKRKPVTSVLLGAKDFFLGSIGQLETVLVRGERLPTWKEVGLAGLDVAVIAGGLGGVAKAVRVGAIAEKSTARLTVEGAYEAISGVGKTSVRAAPIAFIYVALTRPELIASAGGWVAEQLGIPGFIGIFAVYFIGIWLVLQLLRPLIWCCRSAGFVYRCLRHVSRYSRHWRSPPQPAFALS